MSRKPRPESTSAATRATSRWRSSCRCARGGYRRCSGSGRASRSSAPGPSPAATSSRERPSSRRSAATSRARSTSASWPTSSSSRRCSDPGRNPLEWELATAYLGLVPAVVDPAVPGGHALAPGRAPAGARLRPPRDRARGPRPPAGEALVHQRRLRARAAGRSRSPSCASLRGRARPPGLGHNLQRVLLRRGVLEPTASAAPRAASAAVRRRSSAFARAAWRSPTSSPCSRPPGRARVASVRI